MTTSPPRAGQPWTRRLSDKLRLAFHTACDEATFSAAERLLNQLCKNTLSREKLDRRKPENLSGACERLANLLLWRTERHVNSPAQLDEDQTHPLPPGRTRH